MKTNVIFTTYLKFNGRSLFRNMRNINRQTTMSLTVIGMLMLLIAPHIFMVNAIGTAAASPRIRSRNTRNPDCSDDDQRKMQEEYRECQNRTTQSHHQSTATADTLEENQKYTCQLISDTVRCDDLMQRCLSEEDVMYQKDTHIAARLNQYSANTDGIKLEECDVVKEYLESGRGDRMDETTMGACTVNQQQKTTSDFQQCSRNLSSSLWDTLNKMKEQKHLDRIKKLGVEEEETNDVLEEEARDDEEKLDPLTELKPVLCQTLQQIGEQCGLSIAECFSVEDMDQMRHQHIEQMAKYFSDIYDDIDLSDCPALVAFAVSSPDDEYDEEGDYKDDDGEPAIYPDPSTEGENDNSDDMSPTSSSILSSGDSISSNTNIEHVNGQDDSDPYAQPKTQTDNEGNCNQARYIFIAMTSVILSLLCN